MLGILLRRLCKKKKNRIVFNNRRIKGPVDNKKKKSEREGPLIQENKGLKKKMGCAAQEADRISLQKRKTALNGSQNGGKKKQCLEWSA